MDKVGSPEGVFRAFAGVADTGEESPADNAQEQLDRAFSGVEDEFIVEPSSQRKKSDANPAAEKKILLGRRRG